MSSDSTRKPRSRKAVDRPKKPYPSFPLTPHPGGAWQKKIRGKIHYFGRWAHRVNGKLERIEGDGWKEALELYKAVADDLHAGRTPRVKSDGLTVADLCNRFLTAKQRQREAGEISVRMFDEYKATTDRLVSTLGKTRLVDDLAADDFEALRDAMAKQWGPVRLGNEIQKVRTVFKYGFEAGLIETPVRYGPQFKKPSASVLRRHRAKSGERMLEAGEVCRLLSKAGTQVKAMLLLGVNAGFGNHDVATLPLSALDLDAGWVSYPRPKTGIPRRCPLWPETVAALRAAIAKRPEPRQEEAAGLVFVTTRGRPWLTRGIANPVSVAARDLMKTTGIHHEGIGFYTLRHVFRTVADAARDPVAIDLIMGHIDPSMGGYYRERIEDERLKAVADHVRQWLFGKAPDYDGTTEPDSKTPETSNPSDPPKQDTGNDRPTLRLFAG
ncbi:MAG: integrase [Planctomycetes bacterium]|nr:integrase [Planctomycetota bacterium]